MKPALIYAVIIAVHLLALLILIFPRGDRPADTGTESEAAGIEESDPGAGGEEVAETEEPDEPEPAYETYRVRSGDNLTVIARRHGTTVAALKELNDLRNDVIHPGQELLVPASDDDRDSNGR